MSKLIDPDWSFLILSDFVDYAYYLGWGVIALISLNLLLKYIVQPLMSECFQQKAKKNAFEQEKFWHEKSQEDKEDALDLKIGEFEELTLHQKLLDKVIEKGIDDKVANLEETLKELKKKYDSLNGEIEQIIIKKKQ